MIDARVGDEHLGIFIVDLGVRMLCPFTRSSRELHDALNAVLRTPPVSVTSPTKVLRLAAPPITVRLVMVEA
jgi:hypothetical protein